MSSIHRDSGIQGGGKHKGFTPETGTWFIDVFIHLGRKSTLFLLLVSPRAPPRPPPMPPSATGNFCLLHPISPAKPTLFRPRPCARGEDSFPGVKKKKKTKRRICGGYWHAGTVGLAGFQPPHPLFVFSLKMFLFWHAMLGVCWEGSKWGRMSRAMPVLLSGSSRAPRYPERTLRQPVMASPATSIPDHQTVS